MLSFEMSTNRMEIVQMEDCIIRDIVFAYIKLVQKFHPWSALFFIAVFCSGLF